MSRYEDWEEVEFLRNEVEQELRESDERLSMYLAEQHEREKKKNDAAASPLRYSPKRVEWEEARALAETLDNAHGHLESGIRASIERLHPRADHESSWLYDTVGRLGEFDSVGKRMSAEDKERLVREIKYRPFLYEDLDYAIHGELSDMVDYDPYYVEAHLRGPKTAAPAVIKAFEAGGSPGMRMAGEAIPAINAKYAALRELAVLSAQQATKTGYAGIDAGHLVEALLADPRSDAIVNTPKNSFDRRAFAQEVGGYYPKELVVQALDDYALPNGLVAHYRHGASEPSKLSGLGLRIYAPEHDGDPFKAVSNSMHRESANGFEGITRHNEEYWRAEELANQLEFRKDRGWFSNFVDPTVREEFGLSVMPHQGRQSLVTWPERIGVGSPGTPANRNGRVYRR